MLGPLLFLIFIQDMGEKVKPDEALILKFVDDSKALKGVKTEEDVEELQEIFDSLYSWQEDNNIRFNTSKFQILRIGNNEDLKHNTNLFTNNMNDILVPVENVKYLGLIVDDKADSKAQRTKMKASWVLRTFIC